MPRLHRVVPVVIPAQLVADLREPAVDEHAVLGEPRTRSPFRAELQADHVTTVAARAAAPIPGDARRPAAPAHIEDAPRVAVRTADRAAAPANRQCAGRGARLVLRREVEQLVAPRDDHVDRLVAGRKRDRHVERAGAAVGLGPRRDEVRAVFVVGDAQVEAVAIDRQRVRGRDLGQRDPFVWWHDDRAPAGFVRDEVGPPDVCEPEVIDVGVHRRDDEVAREDRPIVPPLVGAGPAAQVGAVQRSA